MFHSFDLNTFNKVSCKKKTISLNYTAPAPIKPVVTEPVFQIESP